MPRRAQSMRGKEGRTRSSEYAAQDLQSVSLADAQARQSSEGELRLRQRQLAASVSSRPCQRSAARSSFGELASLRRSR
jgi:hypothetical protein